jgi:hypothetical protein
MKAGRRQAECAPRENQVRRKMKVFPVSPLAPDCIAQLLPYSELIAVS